MTSKTHQFKNAKRVYTAELIYSTGVLGFQAFKPVFRIYNKLRLHTEILKGHCHAIWQLYKKPESDFASVEFQN